MVSVRIAFRPFNHQRIVKRAVYYYRDYGNEAEHFDSGAREFWRQVIRLKLS